MMLGVGIGMILRIGTLVLLKTGVQLVNSAYVWDRGEVMCGWLGWWGG